MQLVKKFLPISVAFLFGLFVLVGPTGQALAADSDGYLEDYIDKILVHMWEEPKKMDDLEVIKAAFEESGLDSNRLLEQMQDPEIKAQLITNTEAAVERGVFGIPTFFVGDEMYFGKDTLWQVEEKLSE